MKTQGKLALKILGLDSSAIAASCAVVEKGSEATPKILASGFINMKITHSQTLMPLVESMLKSAGLTLNDIDCFAVSNGPGSFTGLRIAVSAVKAMAFATDKPVCGVSTLESLAYNLLGQDCTACPTMDARREEVYNAIFDIKGDKVTRLTPDRAISLEDLRAELSQYSNVIFVGDGAHLAGTPAAEALRWQSAVSVCMAAKEFINAKELMPVYIRKPQAEREREEKS